VVLKPNTDMVLLGGSYVTFDNIELTGFATSGGSGGNMVQIVNDHTAVEHAYFHGADTPRRRRWGERRSERWRRDRP
jgi:hypothetical protein